SPSPGSREIEVVRRDNTFNAWYYGLLIESRSLPPGAAPGGMPPGATTTFVNTATPPANNDFANRITLGPALPVTANGSTVYGTLETGESNLNDRAGASVWYEWTASATGWTRISASTSGSNRPIFALFTGSTVASLQEQGRSDNYSSFGSQAPGPLVFQATAGTTYHIAVYGFAFGETTNGGNFSLTLESIAPPAARITSFSLTPSIVDVASGPQTVTLQLNLASDTAFSGDSYLNAYLTPTTSLSGGGALSSYIPSTARIAGTDTNGTYQTTFQLPGWHEPGLWNMVVDVSHAGFRTWSPTGSNIIGDKFLIPQSGGQVNLTNSGAVDSTGPVLVSLSGLPTFANVSTPVPVTLNLTITDDASGFTSGQISLSTTNGSSLTSYGMGGFGAAQRTSGTALNGTYQVTFNLTNAMIEGDYDLQIDLFDAYGRLGRSGGYLGSEFPAGSNHEVTISYGPAAGGYSGWAALQNFGPGGLDGLLEDANQDGTRNLLCYAFNMPPLPFAVAMSAGGTSGLPLITVVGEGASRRVRIEYLRRRGPSGLTYLPQFCSDPGAAGPGGWQTGTPPPATIIDTDWERVIVDDAVTGASARLGRVAVEYSDSP
ncbi:MAG: hypothetical protein ACKO2G_05960, partial [Verrucomicrobiales bacterium]